MVDRISSLPDEVLCHILSFLETKDSVRTTILSTRWMYLFTRVPIFDFDFPYNTNSTRSIDFVNGFFLMYNVFQMIKFRVHCVCNSPEKLDNLCLWISSAISRNVRELIIKGGIQMLPRKLFFSKTLSTLKLDSTFDLKIPSSACLPCLKTLHLQYVCFGSSAKRILSICPVLENLHLGSCKFEDVDALDISHPTLKTLWIAECHDYVLVLNAPSLLQFDYLSSRINGIISEIVSTSLVKGRICPEPYYCSQIPNNLEVPKKLVDVVSHARHLYLSKSSLEAFRGSYQTLPTFCNLTRLEVAHVSRVILELLPYLLNRSSHLKVLIFDRGFNEEKSNATDLIGFEIVPSCVSGNLNEIVFKEFSMKEIEIKLVEYFMKNAKVLDTMIIQPYGKIDISLARSFWDSQNFREIVRLCS